MGVKNGIVSGQKVFALGNVPIGRVAEVYPDTSKIILYSNPGEKTEVVISGKDTFMQIVGRGGGNFEMILPRDFIFRKGDGSGFARHHAVCSRNSANDNFRPTRFFSKSITRQSGKYSRIKICGGGEIEKIFL